jgi:hypothetical protein
MSNVIKSLFISAIDVNFTADHIIEEFYCQNIATISRITLIPYESISGVRNRAYIDIHEWHPTEAAYNLIKRINDGKIEARFIYSEDNWWVVGVNKKPFVTNSRKMTKFTTVNCLVQDYSLEFKVLPWILNSSSEHHADLVSIEKDLYEMLAY